MTATARIFVADSTVSQKELLPVKKFYIGNTLDGAVFSTALIRNTVPGGSTNKMGTPRFTCFFNAGLTFNVNPARHFGLFTGIDIKNIGFIEKNAGGATVKRRSYNIGMPLGMKVGNMVAGKPYFFAGGGIEMPIQYKEKSFVIRDQKTKISEWFSNRTASVMPYVFLGAAVSHGCTFKVQYYPGNFLNPAFTTNGTQPYAGYNVRLVLVSIGYAMPFKKQTLPVIAGPGTTGIHS